MILFTLLKKINNNIGLTFIELILTLGLLALIAFTSIEYIGHNIDEIKFKETTEELLVIRKAIAGNPMLKKYGERTDFGYLGDIGSIPSLTDGLSALIGKPGGMPVWQLNIDERIGHGWAGPYLEEVDPDITLDAWGNPYIYSPASTPPSLISLGADGLVGGAGADSDITMRIPLNIEKSNVYGFILDSGVQYTGAAEVVINYPDGTGGLSSTTEAIAPIDKGLFSFSGISLGPRSIIIYIPNKLSPIKTIGPLMFVINSNNFMIPLNQTEISLMNQLRKKLYSKQETF